MLTVPCPYCGGQLDGHKVTKIRYAHKPIKKRKKKWYRRFGLFYLIYWIFWWVVWIVLWIALGLYLSLLAIGETFFREDVRKPRYSYTKEKAHELWEQFPPFNRIKKTQTQIYCTVCGHEFG